MSDRKLLPGKFVWFEHVSRETKKAQEFYSKVLGWNAKAFPMGSASYEMILTGDAWDTMIGGYKAPAGDYKSSYWIATVSIDDVDKAAKAATANGGSVLDAPATSGGWLWNELHTSDATNALSFYEKVVGFSHRSMDMGPGEKYNILSRDGVDRGGVTGHVPAGTSSHWLPYVAVDNVDATIASAKKLGARIPVAPEDIPGIGRFSVLEDPTGAVLAVMKPLPMERQP
jgi:predicted enzyme related to lactoylglutathione lyase